MRRAFALAIDENAIAARVMRGQAHPTWLMWGPGVNGYDPKLDVRPKVDLAEAKKLLAEAGYPDGFGITLDCPNDRYVNDEAICTAIVAMLARIGIKVTLNAQTKSKYFGEINTPELPHRASTCSAGRPRPTTRTTRSTRCSAPATASAARSMTAAIPTPISTS